MPEVVEDLHQKEATVIEDEALIVQAQEMLRVAEAKVRSLTPPSACPRRVNARPRRPGPGGSRSTNGSHDCWGKASPQEEMEQTDEKSKTADAAVSESVAGVALARAALVESKARRDKAAADVRVAEGGSAWPARIAIERRRSWPMPGSKPPMTAC